MQRKISVLQYLAPVKKLQSLGATGMLQLQTDASLVNVKTVQGLVLAVTDVSADCSSLGPEAAKVRSLPDW